jgi:hypothetical protein
MLIGSITTRTECALLHGVRRARGQSKDLSAITSPINRARARFCHAYMPLKLSIGVTNVGQAMDFSDGDLRAARCDQPREFREHLGSRPLVVAFRLDALLRRGGEIDDCVDPNRRYA